MNGPWHFAVLSKDTWWGARRARKHLLYEALLKQNEVASIVYANGNRLWWRPVLDDVEMPVPSGMEVFTPTLVFPGERFDLIRRFNRYFMARQLRRRFQYDDGRQALFFYNPRDVDAAVSFRWQARVVFDWTEDWSDFYRDEALIKLQERAVREADAVVAVTEPLAERARKLRGDDQVLYLPNATALPVLPDLEEHMDLRDIPSPRIGYLGHLGPWFDANLVRRIALQKPEYSFVLVGGVSDTAAKQLDDLANVYCPGLYPLGELPAFLSGFDVCIAPYVRENIQGDASKLYDYLTCGKPIVTTPVPGLQRFGDSIRVAADQKEWMDAIEQCVNTSCVSQDRLELAKLHSWDHRAKELLDWLSGLDS